MNFAIQLGFCAAAAGIGWITKKRITESSTEWEYRIAFYDYIECKSESIENVINSANGQILKFKILWKIPSGCLNMNVGGIVKSDHLVVILQTNRDEYWGIEKNKKSICVQRSDREYTIIENLIGVKRDSSLVYDNIKQEYYLNKWNINHSNLYNLAKKSVNINSVLQFLVSQELPIPFSYIENCQVFLGRVINFIFNGVNSSLTIYNYSSDKTLSWDNFYDNIPPNTFVLDVKWLNRKSSFVGFLIKATDGQYWSFEQHFNQVFIQQSHTELVLMKMLNGCPRDEPLKRGNDGFENNLRPSIRKMPITIILQCFKASRKITNDFRGFIEDGLESIYDPRDENFVGLTFYDCREHESMNIITTALHIADSSMVTSVSLLFKLAYDKNDHARDTLINNCTVLLLETSDHQYWSIERDNNFTRVQRSDNEKDLLEYLESIKREKSLSQCISCDGYLKRVTVRGLLEFVIEFHRKVPNKQCEEILQRILQYFRCIKH